MNLTIDTTKYQLVKRQEGEPRSERDVQLGRFRNRLNADRKKGGFSELSIGRIIKMFKGVKTENLHQLYEECEGAKAFGALLKYKLETHKTN